MADRAFCQEGIVMSPRHPRSGKQLPPVAHGSPLAREDLPAPLVYYPNQNGVFHAFASSRSEEPALCACAEEAVRNLFRLGMAPTDYALFPDLIARAFVGRADPMTALSFRPGLCHRCNRRAPSLRYCREMEGQRFVQTYGWYINQTYLRLGIHPSSHRYLPDICPPAYLDILNRIQALSEQARAVRAQLVSLMNGPRQEIPRAPLEAIEQQLSRPRYELANAMQNRTRAELGFRPIGEAWVRENQFYQIICRVFPGEQVIRHCRPEWLEGLELDVFLPGLKLAFEYQGQQHFHPIKAWGGEQALLELQARDARKVQICRQADVRLVTVAYTEPLTDEHIRDRVTGIA
jgi:hypothetical protein